MYNKLTNVGTLTEPTCGSVARAACDALARWRRRCLLQCTISIYSYLHCPRHVDAECTLKRTSMMASTHAREADVTRTNLASARRADRLQKARGRCRDLEGLHERGRRTLRGVARDQRLLGAPCGLRRRCQLLA